MRPATPEKIPAESLWLQAAEWCLTLPAQEAAQRLLEAVARRHGCDGVRFFALDQQRAHFEPRFEWPPSWRGEAAAPRNSHAGEAAAADDGAGDGAGAATLLLRLASKRLALVEELYLRPAARLPARYAALGKPLRALGLAAYYAAAIREGGQLVALVEFHARRPGAKGASAAGWSLAARREMRAATALVGKALKVQHREETAAAGGGTLLVEHEASTLSLPVAHIVRIEAEGARTRLCLADGRRLSVARSMEEWEQALAPHAFFRRVHRSHFANLRHIVRFRRNSGNWQLSMSDGSELPVGRLYRPALRDAEAPEPVNTI